MFKGGKNLPEVAIDVIAGKFILRVVKNIVYSTKFYQLSQVHKCDKTSHTLRLLHVVGDDNDCIVLL